MSVCTKVLLVCLCPYSICECRLPRLERFGLAASWACKVLVMLFGGGAARHSTATRFGVDADGFAG
jgi:hypothetical protein